MPNFIKLTSLKFKDNYYRQGFSAKAELIFKAGDTSRTLLTVNAALSRALEEKIRFMIETELAEMLGNIAAPLSTGEVPAEKDDDDIPF